MNNGFYNTDDLSEEIKRKVIDKAIKLAFVVKTESKYKNGSNYREIDKELTIQQVIDEGLNNPKHRLEVINRDIYNQGLISDYDSEVVLHYEWTFLYCLMTHDNVNKLANQFNLSFKYK